MELLAKYLFAKEVIILNNTKGGSKPEIRDNGHGTSSNPGLSSIRPGSSSGTGGNAPKPASSNPKK